MSKLSESPACSALKEAGFKKNVLVAEMVDLDQAVADLEARGMKEVTLQKAVEENIYIIALMNRDQFRLVTYGTMSCFVINETQDNCICAETVILQEEEKFDENSNHRKYTDPKFSGSVNLS